eukprot:1139715-Pyramimonas_sp.AAC.2
MGGGKRGNVRILHAFRLGLPGGVPELRKQFCYLLDSRPELAYAVLNQVCEVLFYTEVVVSSRLASETRGVLKLN